MALSLFDLKVDLTDEWEDRTVYTFSRSGDDGAGGAAPSAAFGGLMALRGMGGAAGGGRGGPVQTFNSSVVVMREDQNGRSLFDFVREQRKAILDNFPGVGVVGEQSTTIGSYPANEQEFKLSMEHPLPQVAQFHLTVERDGSFYHFCCTATQKNAQKDAPKFRSLVESWAAG